MPEGVTLITPTGMRSVSFMRCAFYVFRFARPENCHIQWIVVDDGVEPMSVRFDALPEHITLQMIRPEHRWAPGVNTLAQNILAALPEVIYEKILIIEDDDRYDSQYLITQMKRLETESLVGEIPSRYYHVPFLRYRIFENRVHASLCQTGMHKSVLPALESVCRASPQFIDFRLWDAINSTALFESNLCVGIKGMSGREGIGVGHKAVGAGWRSDSDRKILHEWLGSDASLYTSR
jgi:hypothetical protein